MGLLPKEFPANKDNTTNQMFLQEENSNMNGVFGICFTDACKKNKAAETDAKIAQATADAALTQSIADSLKNDGTAGLGAGSGNTGSSATPIIFGVIMAVTLIGGLLLMKSFMTVPAK